jgi:hypothetical protein
MVMLTRKELLVKIEDLEAKLSESLTLEGQHRIISAFEDEIASLQYAKSAIRQLDKDYGMDSSEHIAVLERLINACIAEAKSARKGLTLK